MTINDIQCEIDKTAYNVVQLTNKYKIKISAVESCTGGLITAALTSVSGSSNVLDMGICTYANSAKTQLVGVPPSILAKHGAVSPHTAIFMARGMLKTSDSDIAVSVTGVAGPTGGTERTPVGTVWCGLALHGGCMARLFYTNPTEAGEENVREYIRKSTVLKALKWAEEMLILMTTYDED